MCTYMIAIYMYACSQHPALPVLSTVSDQEEVGRLPHRVKQQDKKVYVVEDVILLTQCLSNI